MTARRNALGRGLGALLPAAPAADAREIAEAREDASGDTVAPAAAEIPVERIVPNPDQPRRVFEEAELARLADSVRRHGLLQPVVVRRAGADRYELVVGERRWRAAQRAGRETIPAVIADVDPRDRLELALVENVQRHDLNPIELALAFRALTEGGATQEEVGRRVGLERPTIANHLRLLELPRSLQEDVEAGRLSAGHAKALLSVANPEQRLHLRDRILREGLSVRETEARARGATPRRSRSPRRTDAVDPDMRALVDTLCKRLQTRVRITGSAERGRIEIDFFGAEDLDRLVHQMLLGGDEAA